MVVRDILRETEGGGAATTQTQGLSNSTTTAVDLIPRTEAVEAFKARDKAKQALRELQESGLVLTPEQKAEVEALRAAKVKAEEERKRKEGEFDSWRADFAKKTEEQIAAERERAVKVTERLHTTLKDHAFASASDWFGGSDAKTILTPAIASAYFGRYVAVEEHDGAERVVVRDPNGHAILDTKTGKPAAFAQAIGELIGMLPDRDSVLRGSGKTGSGSSGGSHGTQTPDLAELTKRASKGDKDAITALRRQQSSLGGISFGDGRMVS